MLYGKNCLTKFQFAFTVPTSYVPERADLRNY